MLRTVLIVSVIALTGFSAQNALAQSNTSDVKVTFLDRDLRDPAKLEASYRRLYDAAKKACWSEGQGPSYRIEDDRACELQAVDEAVMELHSVEMTRVHKEHMAISAPQFAMSDRKAR